LSFVLFSLPLVLISLPACSSTKGSAVPNKKEQDPLLGNYDPKKGNEGTMTQAKSVPPVPAFQTSASTADLAAAIPLNGPRPALAIPNDQAKTNPGGGTWTGQVQPTAALNTNPNSGGAPQPVPVLNQSVSLPDPGGNASPAAPRPTYEQLQMALQQRGMRWQNAEQIPGGVRFSCTVPHPQNPKAERLLQAEAPDIITAMQAVLAKVDSPVP
jgi:hypothetical protein